MTDSNTAESLEAFRGRVRSWLPVALEPLDGADPFMGHSKDDENQVVRSKAIQRKLWDAGFAGLCFPEAYGGQGLPAVYQRAFNQEAVGYELPMLFNTPTLTIIAPTILDFGTEEQKRRIIPSILRGEELWVQFLSEPSGGSALAAALTQAVRDGDLFILNGSKIWSTYAWKSDYALCVCRTDWDAPKHRGLSVLIVKIHQPGIQIDQIRHVDGTDEFCQEFFDDVPIPVDDVLGQVNDGWTVASRLLLHERSAVSGSSPYEVGASSSDRRSGQFGVGGVARATGRVDDPRIRQLVGEARTLTRVHQALSRRIPTVITIGRLPPPAGSIARLSSGLLGVRLSSIALEIAGSRAVAWE